MLTVKLTIPGQPSCPDLSQYTGNRHGVISGCRFVGNDPTLKHADVWMVLDGLDQPETCSVTAGCTVFLAVEVLLPLNHYLTAESSNFLAQFNQVHVCHAANHPRAFRDIPFQAWMINANHGSFFEPSERDLNWLKDLDHLPKTHEISVLCSSIESTPAHSVRLAFVKALKERLGERLHWFGNGINRINQKWEGIAPYKYTIVLENQRADDIITEKICDSFLAYACPIYWGAPNASSYFPDLSFEEIDVTNIDNSVSKVEKILAKDEYQAKLPYIQKARNLVLNEYNWLERIARISKELHSRALTSDQLQEPVLMQLQPFKSFCPKPSLANRMLNLSKRIRHRIYPF